MTATVRTYNLSSKDNTIFQVVYEPDTHSHKSCPIIFDESKMS